MAMNYGKVKYVLVITLIAFASLTLSGCGKNTLGPTAPAALAPQAAPAVLADGVSAPDEVVAAGSSGGNNGYGYVKGRKKAWQHHHFSHYRRLLNYLFVRFFARYLALKWFEDPDVFHTVKRIVNSPMFFVVYVRCGVGDFLVNKVLRILSDTWFPGIGTNPSGCDPEVTLLPFRWKMGRGFYGGRLDGWGKNDVYKLESWTPDLDCVSLETNSHEVDIYENQTPIITYKWKYDFKPFDSVNGVSRFIGLKVKHQPWDKILIIPGGKYDTRIRENGNCIIADDVWASTENKSACCSVSSLGTGGLTINLLFAEDGSGDGSLDIERNGSNDHYEFVVKCNGHGYYIKNYDGRKRRF